MEEYIKEDQAGTQGEQEHHYKPKHDRFLISKINYYALIIIFAGVFLLSAIYLGGYFLETGSAEEQYDDLAALRQQGLASIATSPQGNTGNNRPNGPTGTTEGTGPVETQPPTILPELQAIYNMNSDMVGYLSFPNKNLGIEFPVMQSPADEDYYLSHDFYGKESIVGCPYVPLNCDVYQPSDNVVIYGHNLKTGGMFNKLTWYREKSYWENNQTFQFDTLYERHTYRIFAVFKTAAKQYTSDGKAWGYPYHRINNFSSKEEFDEFIADIKGDAFTSGEYQGWTFYDTGITPQYGDKLLCLSTCEYTMQDPDGTTNGRLVVMAVRVD